VQHRGAFCVTIKVFTEVGGGLKIDVEGLSPSPLAPYLLPSRPIHSDHGNHFGVSQRETSFRQTALSSPGGVHLHNDAVDLHTPEPTGEKIRL